MKKYITVLFVFLMLPFITVAQEDDTTKENDTIVKKVKEKLERSAFESSYIIDNPTNIVYRKNTLEVMMQHRFGVIDFDNGDLAGIYADGANIRIAVAYSVHDRVMLGFGTTKNKRYQDLNWKVAVLQQTRSEKMPVSLTYFGNIVYNAQKQANTNPPISYQQDRFSYFHQLIVARRFTPSFSMQATLSVSHYNTVKNTMRNDMVAFSLGGRFKVTPNTAILIDYSQPLTKFMEDNPHPGISAGVEFGTSAHAFQIFIGNYSGIVPQENYMFNSNDFFNGDILIGFNITRNYNF